MIEPQTIKAKYKGYCFKCHYTIWNNELIVLTGKVSHIDCMKALKDKTPRQLDNKYLGIYGQTNKKKMKKLLNDPKRLNKVLNKESKEKPPTGGPVGDLTPYSRQIQQLKIKSQ